MDVVKVELPVGKEGKEVADLMVELTKKLKSKADLNTYTDLLDELMLAMDGINKLSDEMKSKYRNELGCYLSWQLLEVLVPDAPKVPADAPAEAPAE